MQHRSALSNVDIALSSAIPIGMEREAGAVPEATINGDQRFGGRTGPRCKKERHSERHAQGTEAGLWGKGKRLPQRGEGKRQG
jgi:hypothetical protein